MNRSPTFLNNRFDRLSSIVPARTQYVKYCVWTLAPRLTDERLFPNSLVVHVREHINSVLHALFGQEDTDGVRKNHGRRDDETSTVLYCSTVILTVNPAEMIEYCTR